MNAENTDSAFVMAARLKGFLKGFPLLPFLSCFFVFGATVPQIDNMLYSFPFTI